MLGKKLSHLLVAYYRGPDHPMKLRVWSYLRRLLGYQPLTIAYGTRHWISVDERDWLQSAILSRGTYEPEVWQALAECAATHEVVWDVGAHIGSFALTATLDSRVDTVCVFEPDPLTLARLRSNLALNGNPATIFPLALSDMRQTGTLIHGPANNTGMSTLSPSASTGMLDHLSQGQPDRMPTFDVACETADYLVEHSDAPAPTLMKIDVEGWEYPALLGAKRLLQSGNVKAIAFETACDAAGGVEDHRLVGLLREYGYSIHHIPRPGGERLGVENYLAARG